MIVPYLLIIIFIIKLTFLLTSFASQIKFLVRDPSPEREREREIERDRASCRSLLTSFANANKVRRSRP